MSSLKNKVIIVTGGSGLLGKAIINDIKSKDGIAINASIEIETDIEGGQIQTDITSPESVVDCINLTLEKFEKIDGLVNNAYPRTDDWGAEFEDIEFNSWKKNIDMHLNGYFYFSQQVYKEMKRRQAGSIVNMASIYGVIGNDFTLYEGTNIVPPAAYSAIKGGLVNYTRYLASLGGQFGIRINCVSPGGIFDNQDPKFVERYEQKVPMKRMGKPNDIAPVVSFLLSDNAGYITGQNLIVDGGWTIV